MLLNKRLLSMFSDYSMENYSSFIEVCDKELPSRSESGAIIPFVAMFIGVFAFFLLLAVDLMLVSSSREEAQNTADLAVMQALVVYMSERASPTTSNGSYSITHTYGRMKDEIAKITGINNIVGDPSAQLAHITYGLFSDSTSPFVLEVGGVIDLDDDDYRNEVVTECPGLCHGGKRRKCFVSNKELLNLAAANPATRCSEAIGTPATAIRLRGKIFPDIKTRFASLLPGNSVNDIAINIDSIAHAVPRKGCFVIDISPSMTAKNHVPSTRTIVAGNRVRIPGERFSYFLEDSEVSTGTTNADVVSGFNFKNHEIDWNITVAADSSYERDSGDQLGATYVDSTPWTNREADYREAPLVYTDAEYTTGTDFHGRHPCPNSDWILPTGTTTVDCSASATGHNHSTSSNENNLNGRYVVDVVDRPEPLATVLEQIKGAVDTFALNKIDADRLCLIFHDHTLTWTRVFNMTNDFDYLKSVLDPNPQFAAAGGGLLDTDGLGKMMKHGLFPSRQTYTNVSLGFQAAQRQFVLEEAASGRIQAQNFIVYFGDGVSNCSGLATNNCENTYDKFVEAMTELDHFADALKADAIPIHVIQTGDHVGPHFRMIPKDSTDPTVGCLTDEEFRLRALSIDPTNTNFVLGLDPSATIEEKRNSFDAMSDSSPFYGAAPSLYQLALKTNGFWMPLLKYEGAGAAADASSECNRTFNNCVRNERQLFSCDTQADQIDAHLRKIIGETPFILFKETPKPEVP